MPVRVLIEEDALSATGSDKAVTKANHIRFLEAWMRHGVLVLDSASDGFSRTIEAMPAACRKIWQVALKSEKFRKVSVELPEPNVLFESSSSVVACAHAVDLVCLEETRANLYFLDEGGHAKHLVGNSFEICRFDCADQSQSFVDRRRLWDQPIYIGETRSTIWGSRFSGLSLHARHISIVDRYAGKTLVEKHSAGESCGLARYLQLLNKLDCVGAKKKVLNIYLSDVGTDLMQLELNLRKIVSSYGKNLASVRLFVGQYKLFSKVAHDRFLRFDALVTSVGRGVSIFEDDRCAANFSCGIMVDIAGDFEKNVERMLRPSSDQRIIL
jgi:hypothetical protein